VSLYTTIKEAVILPSVTDFVGNVAFPQGEQIGHALGLFIVKIGSGKPDA
jgi:hypothetical protein